MGVRFRKAIKILPGIKLNLSKKGIGISAGVKGAHISTGPAGQRLTTSIPGTGLSYISRSHKKSNARHRMAGSNLDAASTIKLIYELSGLQSEKNKTTALCLCIFLGYFGAHYFYVNRIGKGLIYFLTVGLFGIGWIIDIFVILTGNFKDSFGAQLRNAPQKMIDQNIPDINENLESSNIESVPTSEPVLSVNEPMLQITDEQALPTTDEQTTKGLPGWAWAVILIGGFIGFLFFILVVLPG
jgi:hypothetical protein